MSKLHIQSDGMYNFRLHISLIDNNRLQQRKATQHQWAAVLPRFSHSRTSQKCSKNWCHESQTSPLFESSNPFGALVPASRTVLTRSSWDTLPPIPIDLALALPSPLRRLKYAPRSWLLEWPSTPPNPGLLYDKRCRLPVSPALSVRSSQASQRNGAATLTHAHTSDILFGCSPFQWIQSWLFEGSRDLDRPFPGGANLLFIEGYNPVAALVVWWKGPSFSSAHGRRLKRRDRAETIGETALAVAELLGGGYLDSEELSLWLSVVSLCVCRIWCKREGSFVCLEPRAGESSGHLVTRSRFELTSCRWRCGRLTWVVCSRCVWFAVRWIESVLAPPCCTSTRK